MAAVIRPCTRRTSARSPRSTDCRPRTCVFVDQLQSGSTKLQSIDLNTPSPGTLPGLFMVPRAGHVRNVRSHWFDLIHEPVSNFWIVLYIQERQTIGKEQSTYIYNPEVVNAEVTINFDHQLQNYPPLCRERLSSCSVVTNWIFPVVLVKPLWLLSQLTFFNHSLTIIVQV